MVNKTYTQRDFAAIAGLSTSTIVKMLKRGDIQKDSDGRIPAAELNRIYALNIAKYKEFGSLLITFDKTDEELTEIKQNYINSEYVKQHKNTLNFYTSIQDIIDTATNMNPIKTENNRDELSDNYNRKILATFISKYKVIVSNYMSTLLDTKEYESFCNLPAKLAYEYLLCGSFSETNGVVEIFLADKEAVKKINQHLDNKFRLLMIELHLYWEKEDQLVFDRALLDYDFFKKTGEVYNSYFSSKNPKRPSVYLNRHEKINVDLSNRNRGQHIKNNLDNLLTDDFVFLLNINSSKLNIGSDYVDDYTRELLTIIDSDMYSTVVITETGDIIKDKCLVYCYSLAPILARKSVKSYIDALRG